MSSVSDFALGFRAGAGVTLTASGLPDAAPQPDRFDGNGSTDVTRPARSSPVNETSAPRPPMPIPEALPRSRPAPKAGARNRMLDGASRRRDGYASTAAGKAPIKVAKAKRSIHCEGTAIKIAPPESRECSGRLAQPECDERRNKERPWLSSNRRHAPHKVRSSRCRPPTARLVSPSNPPRRSLTNWLVRGHLCGRAPRSTASRTTVSTSRCPRTRREGGGERCRGPAPATSLSYGNLCWFATPTAM